VSNAGGYDFLQLLRLNARFGKPVSGRDGLVGNVRFTFGNFFGMVLTYCQARILAPRRFDGSTYFLPEGVGCRDPTRRWDEGLRTSNVRSRRSVSADA